MLSYIGILSSVKNILISVVLIVYFSKSYLFACFNLLHHLNLPERPIWLILFLSLYYILDLLRLDDPMTC